MIEGNPIWNQKIVARLVRAKAIGDTVGVCDLVRAECLIGLLKTGNSRVLADYQRFFSNPIVQMLPVTPAVCERAAEIRVASAMRIKLPDALHLASAMVHGCGLFLTNDEELAVCEAIKVEVLT